MTLYRCIEYANVTCLKMATKIVKLGNPVWNGARNVKISTETNITLFSIINFFAVWVLSYLGDVTVITPVTPFPPTLQSKRV